jgi:hypothetical protein
MKVIVYCNTKRRLLSVKALEGSCKGRVVMHAERLLVRNAEFRVSQAGRERVVRTQRKSVHAGIVGEVEAIWGASLRDDLDNNTIKELGIGKPFRPFDGESVRYNPYETETFVSGEKPVHRAARVLLDGCTMLAQGLQ